MTNSLLSNLPTDPIWVDSSAQLNTLCESWQQQGAVAIDTEFMRTSTFYPIAALFQVSDGQGCYLIDPLVIEDFSGFKALLTNPSVVKVLHACSEDLEVFQTFLGVLPSPLFDSQWAAACAGYDFSMGYARLIEETLAVTVAKSETRSDWLQRPLSEPQLRYAALDVAYLLVAYGLLLKKLKADDRLTWVEDDCAQQVAVAAAGSDFSAAYIKIKSAWKLSSRELAVLQALAQWREQAARERDVPRNRLAKDGALWDLARTQPDSVAQLPRIEGLAPRTVRGDGETILALIADTLAQPTSTDPARLPEPLARSTADLVKALKQSARQVAEDLSVPAEILLRKKDIEALVRSGLAGRYLLPERLLGWRKSVVGDRLLQLAEQWPA